MKVLMTGATGMIGRPLVAQLYREGHEITVLTRDPVRAQAAIALPVTWMRWDGLGSLPVGIFGFDGVIHLAGENIGAKRWTPEQKKKVRESRILGLENLWKSLESPPKVFISASATGFYGDRGDEELTESSKAGNDFVAELCVDWEKALFENERGKGVRKVAMRTGIVLGRSGGLIEKMLPVFRLGLGGKLGSGKSWMSWIHLEDLVEMYSRALAGNDWSGPVNAVSPAPVRNAEFTKALARVLRRPAFMRVPEVALRAALGEFSEIVLASARVLPQKASQCGFRFVHPSLDGALRDLLG